MFDLDCRIRWHEVGGALYLTRMAGWNGRVMYSVSHIRPSLPTGTYIYIAASLANLWHNTYLQVTPSKKMP